MELRALFHKRRYRRLSVALFAAFMVHLGLVLTGNWGILLSSAPSNQDRVLTLTLENTTHEGLKETSFKEEDTVNDARLGKAAEPPQKLVTQTKTQDAPKPQLETKREVNEKNLEDESFDTKIDNIASNEAVNNAPPSDSQPPKASEPIEFTTERSSTPPSHPDLPLELITSTESLIDLVEAPLVDVAEDPLVSKAIVSEAIVSEALVSKELVSKALETTEVEMLNKKVERWSSSIAKNIALQEPLLWEENGHQYKANFTEMPAKTDMDNDQVLIEIATDRDGKKLTTSLRLKKMAFSNFAQFVHQWDPDVSVHNDEMNGRFHSNTRLSLIANRKGAPLFHGKVTTASYFVDIEGNVPRKDIFLAGLETGVKKISMPKPSVLFDQVQSDSTAQSVLIETNSRLIFNPDGSYLLQACDEFGVMQRHQIGDRPLYILAAPGVSLSLSGTVNGAVAVYSPKRIIIEGDLEYLSTDSIDRGGDFLGLISGRSIVIAKREIVPAGDLNIQAAIYAKNRFQVKQLHGKRAGTLNILGSVSAGSISATEPRYATNIVFDTRLENLRPPGFPVTDRYELLAKQNSWQIDNDPFYESIDPVDFAQGLIDGGAEVDLDATKQLD